MRARRDWIPACDRVLPLSFKGYLSIVAGGHAVNELMWNVNNHRDIQTLVVHSIFILNKLVLLVHLHQAVVATVLFMDVLDSTAPQDVVLLVVGCCYPQLKSSMQSLH